MDVCRRFIIGLEEIGLTHDEIKTWVYIGGEHVQHLSYFNLKIKDVEIGKPEHKDRCICKTKIQQNCWITKDYKNILVIGNCCLKHFLPECGRTCGRCGKSHRNYIIDRCNECKFKCDICLGDKQELKELLCNYCKKKKCISCDKEISYCYDSCFKCNQKLIQLQEPDPIKCNQKLIQTPTAPIKCKSCDIIIKAGFKTCYKCYIKQNKPA